MVESIKNRIGLLLGSGITYHANGPHTDEITDNIIYGYRELSDKSEQNIRSFLGFLKCEIIKYYEKHDYPRVISYEDLYEILNSIVNSEVGEWDNPIVDAFIEKISPRIQNYINNGPIHNTSKNDGRFSSINSLCQNSRDYILKILIDKINYESRDFDPRKNLYNLTDKYKLDIYTLNHDLLLEKFLCDNQIEFYDGFKVISECLSEWHPLGFKDENNVNMLKLHGSLNWEKDQKVDHGGEVIIKRKDNRQYVDPVILVGTFSKMLQYSAKPFIDLLSLFNLRLNKIERLIISGYSFGDKGINSIILGWFGSNSQNKIMVISPSINNLTRSARPAIGRMLSNDKYKCDEKLILIEKKFENVCINDIIKFIDN